MPAGDRLTVFSQGQGVHDDQRQIAAILGIGEDRVTVELVTNGGAFGGKEDLSVQAHASVAAWLTRRPVRIVLTREQSLRIHPKRHPITMHYRAGCDAEGRLTAVEARMIGDTGAYASVGAKVLERAAGHSCGPYRVVNVDVESTAVYTNNPPCGAMRGFGANQAAFAMEGILDRLAEKVGRREIVLVDEVGEEAVQARGPWDAPEIDGKVIIEGPWDLEPWDFIEVEITRAGDHDLWARPVDVED